MDDTQIKQYKKKGMAAVKDYELSKITMAIDEAVTKTELNYSHSESKFRNKTLEISELILGGKPTIYGFVNKNKYYNKALKFIDEYVETHKEELNQFTEKIEKELDVKLADLGLNNQFYSDFSKAIKKTGFVGKHGALNVLSDTLMNNLDNVLKLVESVIKEPVAENDEIDVELLMNQKTMKQSTKKISVNNVLEFIKSTGMTSKEVQEAYSVGGFKGEKGVISYVTDKVLLASTPFVNNFLDSIKNEGIDHQTSAEAIIDSYKKNGLFNRNGLVESVIGIGMKMPNIDEIIYNQILNDVLGKKRDKEKAELMNEFDGSITSMFYERLINATVNKIYDKKMAIAAHAGIPEVLSKNKLREVFDKNGLFGEKGLYSYLHNNVDQIFANAKKYGLVEDPDVDQVKDDFSKFEMGISVLDAINKKPVESKYEKFSIALARKAEELGIEPLVLLSDNKYVTEKKSAILEGFESIDNYLKIYTFTEIALPIVELAINKIQSGEVEYGAIVQKVYAMRPEKGIWKAAFDKIVEKTLTPNLIPKTEDYLRLTKAFIEYRAAEGKKEKELYQTVA